MRTSRAGLDLIKSFEGFRTSAARLPDGRWIIGYGHVRTAREGLTIDEQDAEDLLLHDLRPAEDAVSTLVYAPLSQNQHDALVSLAFNISPGQFRDSEILRQLNGGDFITAANGFDAWRKARVNGRVIIVDALVRRRAMEKALFLESPPGGRPTAPTQLVTPEYDPTDAPRRLERTPTHPAAANEDDDVAQGGETDIATAVQLLAERTPKERVTPPAPQNDVAPVVEAAPAVTPATKPQTNTSIDEARLAVAERLAKILERTEKTIADSQAAQATADKAQADKGVAEKAKPKVMVAQVKIDVRKSEQVVLEGLPDFDTPAAKPVAAERKKNFIDDTETFDPGRDAEAIFQDALRAEEKVNGHRKLGMDAGFIRLAPWIAVLILSGLGIAIGLTEVFKAPSARSMQMASTVFAVFGLMLVMSIYFVATNVRKKS